MGAAPGTALPDDGDGKRKKPHTARAPLVKTGTPSLHVWPEPRGWKPPKPLSPYRDETSPPVVTHNRFRYLSTKEEPGSVPPTRPTPTPFVALVPKTEVKREKQESFDDVCREFRDSNDSFEPPLGRPVPRRKRRSLAPSPQRASRGHPEPEVPAAAVPTRDDPSPARDVCPRAPTTAPLATTCRRLVTACHEGRRRSRLPPPIPLFPFPRLHPQLPQIILLIRTRGPIFPVSFLLFLPPHLRLHPSSTSKKHCSTTGGHSAWQIQRCTPTPFPRTTLQVTPTPKSAPTPTPSST